MGYQKFSWHPQGSLNKRDSCEYMYGKVLHNLCVQNWVKFNLLLYAIIGGHHTLSFKDFMIELLDTKIDPEFKFRGQLQMLYSDLHPHYSGQMNQLTYTIISEHS